MRSDSTHRVGDVIVRPRERNVALGRGSPTAWIVLALVGCSGASAPERHVRFEEARVIARRGAGDEVEVTLLSPEVLFDEGNARLRAGRCEEAVERYDTLVREFSSSRYVSAALYNAGLCLGEQREWARSVEHFERLLEVRPGSPDEKHARFGLAEGLEALERWASAVDNADALLRRGDLDATERLEALARRARAVLGVGRLDEASRSARDAVAYYRARSAEGAIADEQFAAMAAFVLAETIRLRSEALVLPEGTALEQHDVLERRASLLLDAQRAYFDTIRLGEPRWAAASGYRIGAMYRALFEAMTAAPVPPPTERLTPEQTVLYAETYRRRLRERVRPLLRHAIRYWELTLVMVERTRAESEWTARLRQDLERTRAMLVAESLVDASDVSTPSAERSPPEP